MFSLTASKESSGGGSVGSCNGRGSGADGGGDGRSHRRWCCVMVHRMMMVVELCGVYVVVKVG